MRTTVRLNDDLLREAKKLAAASNRTLTQVLEDSLREMLARRRSAPAQERVTLPVSAVRGRGVRPGVDLDDSASILDIMEASDAPAGR